MGDIVELTPVGVSVAYIAVIKRNVMKGPHLINDKARQVPSYRLRLSALSIVYSMVHYPATFCCAIS